MYHRTDRLLAEGLWKVCFISKQGRPCTWFIFVDDSRDKTIGDLNKLPRLKKGKSLKQVFSKLGIGYVPKTNRLRKKKLKEVAR